METPERRPDETPAAETPAAETPATDESAADEPPYSKLDEETAARCGLWLDDG